MPSMQEIKDLRETVNIGTHGGFWNSFVFKDLDHFHAVWDEYLRYPCQLTLPQEPSAGRVLNRDSSETIPRIKMITSELGALCRYRHPNLTYGEFRNSMKLRLLGAGGEFEELFKNLLEGGYYEEVE